MPARIPPLPFRRPLAALAALTMLAAPLHGEVVLAPRAGGAPVAGELLGAGDGLYRVATEAGEVELLARAYSCAGADCPPPEALVTRFALAGDALAPGLLTALVEGYAAWTGAELEQADETFRLFDGDTPLAEIAILPDPAAAPATGSLELTDAAPRPGARAETIAFDALVPAVAPTNALAGVDMAALPAVARGEITSWKGLGGADVPVNIHAAPLRGAALEAAQRLGWQLAEGLAMDEHARLQDAAIAVANDPFGLAALPASGLGAARALALRDACGFLLRADAFDILSGAYPARFALSVQAAPESLDAPMVAEFMNFLETEAAAATVADFGLVPLSLARRPLDAEGQRLARAVLAAGGAVPLADVQEMVAALRGSERLSAALRLEGDGEGLDTLSQRLAQELIAEILLGNFADKVLILAGFSEGAGPQARNRALSTEHAARVRALLEAMAPEGALDAVIFEIHGFGAAAPLVCEEGGRGAEINRRVEVWVRDRRPGEE